MRVKARAVRGQIVLQKINRFQVQAFMFGCTCVIADGFDTHRDASRAAHDMQTRLRSRFGINLHVGGSF
jgi:hypothetical protein